MIASSCETMSSLFILIERIYSHDKERFILMRSEFNKPVAKVVDRFSREFGTELNIVPSEQP